MMTDLLNVLIAFAVLLIPLGFAWFVLSRTARRHAHREAEMTPKERTRP